MPCPVVVSCTTTSPGGQGKVIGVERAARIVVSLSRYALVIKVCTAISVCIATLAPVLELKIMSECMCVARPEHRAISALLSIFRR